MMNVRPLTSRDLPWLRDRLAHHFAGPRIWSRGVWFDADALPGWVVRADARAGAGVGEGDGEAEGDDAGIRLGAVVHTALAPGEPCEVIALFADRPGRGIGAALLEKVQCAAHAASASRLFLTTTNDNTAALRFYQRRGWRIVAWHHASMDRARALKPGIPLRGAGGIEVHDEIELEWQGGT